MQITKDLRIPGAIWAILLLAGGVLLQAYATPVSALLHVPVAAVVVVVGLIFAAAKAANPGDHQLNNAIDVIEQYQAKEAIAEGSHVTGSVGMRSAAGMPYELPVPIVEVEKIPPRPNKMARVLIG